MRRDSVLKNSTITLNAINIIPTMPQNTHNTLHIIRGRILMKIISDIRLHHVSHLIKGIVMKIHFQPPSFLLSSYSQHATVKTAPMIITLTQLLHAIHSLRLTNIISHDSTRLTRSNSLTLIVANHIAITVRTSTERMNRPTRSIHRVIHINHHPFRSLADTSILPHPKHDTPGKQKNDKKLRA